jgi:F0F1-type ATP synthase assembly protein I
VQDPFAGGRTLARRVVQVQAAAGAVFALAALAHSPEMALAVLWGAASVAAGYAVFARAQMAGVAGVKTLLRRFYGAAAWKWLVLFTLFALGLAIARLPPLGLLGGLIGAQLAGTLALLKYG